MRIDAFDYELPPELVAQRPMEDREASRLLVVPKGTGGAARPDEPPFTGSTIRDLAEVLPAGALVVMNNTRVIPARLLGSKAETGGRVEVFLVKKLATRDEELAPGVVRTVDVWSALGKSSKPLRFGSDVKVGRLDVRLAKRSDEDGLLEVWLSTPSGESIDDAVRDVGAVPLPPYIKREADGADTDRYQTVMARVDGAVAAPTAGLHMTHSLLGRLSAKGCELTTITLHVGLGTFKPVTAEDLDDHPMHAETFHVSQAASQAIRKAREEGRPVVAVGTTVLRALESARDPENTRLVRATSGETRLLVQPGYAFGPVDYLLTNFHLPKSTLLALVCAFGGTERVLAAYAKAVEDRYRFFSYGDAMLLERSDA